ncbi:Crp/Fnr family transcriptional regulator [Virgibacillus profundi]|uniref:Crp/Fnr family transcriptional regulator n=1 Tax=Virgibacillus profundi TaxID=2024555 RepID=A0A2A2IER0_9BACI|nr:Crp/Fnr family transcriptional regulator [Virgibacillus profundi]PAV29796.1 Crp/Fnr family transcriptional regulator [Virgibacillus profundi]PXY53968.1 Crp/Fnr family transcriptional regulator [Virgibacillus profundi]
MEPLLNRLDTYDYDMLLAHSRKLEIKKGNIIYKEGSPSNYLYFILKGQVRIYKDLGPGKEITIFTRNKNDGFGEIGIFSGEKYSNTAEATQKTILYYITKNEIESILGQNGKIGLQFTRWVAESLESSKAKMRDYIAFGSEGAVASVFIRYSNMYGVVTKEGIRITEPIMLKEVSKQIGISRETVSRVVNKWKEQDIVANDNKFFLLKNINYFKKILVCEKCGVENCML